MEKKEELVALKLRKREELLRDFNIHRKACNIILDESFLRVALTDSDVIRNVTNEFAHVKENVLTKQIMESVNYVESLYTTAKKAMPNIQIQPIVTDLVKTLRESDNYYDEEQTTIETEIDQYISERIPFGVGTINDSPKDLRILLALLDTVG